MPVTKYRSVADMPRPAAAASGDLAARIRAVWNRAFGICPPCPPRGVTRYSSIEMSNQARLRSTVERMRKTAGRSGCHDE